DMILVSGFNVYPNEVESVVMMHPGIAECAVVGVPDEKSGEAVKLLIVKKDPNLSREDVISYCKTQLTGYKCQIAPIGATESRPNGASKRHVFLGFGRVSF
ncbi:MAG TPA: hypothetical protein VER68_08970, partial [Azonexus sp.]|nr:hypothetical protein [Azonexus sp.]